MQQTVEPWVQTRYGAKFFPLSPAPEMIDINDIAHSLSMKCRFNGHCTHFVSIAEHSVMVCNVLKLELKVTDPVILLQGLLHDAGEAYLCDVPKPIKSSLTGFVELENDILDVVMEKYGVATKNGALPSLVHAADSLSGIYEYSQNMERNNEGELGFDLVKTENIPSWGLLPFWKPSTARREFISAFDSLTEALCLVSR